MKKHLSFFQCFKIGLHGFFSDFRKTLSTIFLLSCSLLFFGFALSVAFYDEVRVKAESMTKYDKYTVLFSDEEGISEKDLLALQTLTKREYGTLTFCSPLCKWNDFFSMPDTITLRELNEYPISPPNGICYLPNDRNDIQMQGRLPKSKDEIAINSCMMNLFMRFGYIDDTACFPLRYFSTIEEFLSVSPHLSMMDLTTNEPFSAQIVGVVQIPCDTLDHQEENERFGMNDKIFVSKEYAVSVMREKFGVNSIGTYAIGTNATIREAKSLLSQTKYHVYSQSITSVSEITNRMEGLQIVFFVLSGVLFTFSSLILIQFISIAMEKRKQEIGILRALGARKRDILQIFLSQSIFLASLSFFCFVPLLIVSLKGINSFLRHVLSLSIVFIPFVVWVPILLYIASVLVSIFVTLIPIYIRVNRFPIDSLEYDV